MRKSANLTAQQKAIYDLEQFADGPICNILGSAIFIDNYPAEKIKEAIREHYRINDALRMRLKDDDGVLSQYVSDYYPEDVKILYFKDIAERDEYAEKWAKEPIDISGQLYEMRGVIFPDKCGLLCKMHHIIGDAWSISLSCTQINKILQGEIPETYSYLDHVASEQKYIGSSRYNDDRIFFEECFKKCSQPLFLQDIKSKSCFSANRKTFIINEKEKDIFLEQAKNNHSSLFVLFLTALSIYFSRIKMNADKFFIGSTMLNRSGFAEKNTSGLFINTVPILIELDNNGTFFDNLALVKSSSWSTLRRQKYNYAELLDNLRQHFGFPGKLYDVMINYENAILEGFSNSIWHFNGMQTETLVIQIDDRTRNGILTVSYDYLTEIFTENDIARIHSFIMRLLEDAIKNPDKKISELEIAPEEELSFLQGAEKCLPDCSVNALFEEQVEINPEKTAVVAADRTLSYRELNEEANKVARFLIIKGVKKGNIVAFKLTRKSYMLSAIFGILKSGASYLPIDIDSPRERTAFILADSKAKFCITEENIAFILRMSNVENPKIQTKPDDNFCIIYTSGSTGNPKGAVLKHRGIVNFIKNSNVISYFREKNIEPVGVSVNNVTFDYFIAENIVLLACGYKTVLASYEESVNADRFGDLCITNHVNLLQTTPTRFSLFMKTKNPEYFKSFKLLVSSGEPLTNELFARIRRLTDAKVINPLGPSETSVWILDGENVSENDIHLGKPMANTQIYVVDNYMNIVPNGTVGELCVAGECVGAGYLNRPERTAEKFISNPFGGGILYKTGDLVYVRNDGNIVYVGRKDNQIKLNGQRIELAEIESAMSEISGIALAAVVARKNNEGNQLLCAFYSGEKKENSEIRNELGKKLLHYMIPQIITHLDAMPLTSSGKIDRLSLPDIDLENIVSDKEFVEARTEEEKALIEAVKKVLKTDRVSVAGNFFELGGDSIQAIFVVAELRKAGFELSVLDVSRNATIETTALLLKRISEEDGLSILRGEKTVLPESATIASLFEETAAKKADETCIVTDDKNYTFAEFNALVKLLDFEIRKITHGKKQTIAVAAERSIEMYASIYAIIRGGNAYLPIDPAYPKGRIEYMLENSGAELVLTQDKFCGLFNGIKVLNVSETIKSGNAQTEDLPVSALSEDTAYMIYTSGSTGRPKGAKVSHRSLLNRILWMEKACPLDENSVILQKTPFTFDVSLWEIFLWGVSGGKMAFMKPDEHFLPAKITDEIYRKKATVAHFVPSVLDLFVKYLENNPGEREKASTLKDVFVSGEVLNAVLINRFYAMFSAENVKIHNLYGPAECAVDVTFYDCKPHESDPLPIGKPIDNTDIFILDSNMQAVPKGVVGEICIGGANVGQGYVNSGELTDKVFLKNPFGEGKIYKTGDLGYISSENEIIFSGRKDSQIKLNGQRVELAEIENSLSEIEGVALAAVVERKNSEGNQILCAFYSGEKKESAEIRNELGKKLPHYMIPQLITHLDEMPLTSSGKIDRLSLPDTDLENIVSDKEFVEARTEEEKALVEAVKKVLKTDRVSVNDNFFELGGDSIQAIFVVSALQKAGFELSVADITLHGTISEIASLIKLTTDNAESKEDRETVKTIPFTPIMKIYSSIGGVKLKEIAQTQIVSCGKSGENEIREALDAIIEHHDMLRAVLNKTGLEIKSFEGCRPYEMKVKDLRGRQDCAEFIRNDSEGLDLDLENGPLVNTVVYLTDSENFLKITIHHFVIDGVSWRIIVEDLSIALEQLSNGREIRLPGKTASFRAWIENLEDYKRTSAVNEFKYWDGILNSLNKLPDVIPNSIEVHEYEEYSFTLEKTFTEQLLTSANKAFGTHADELLLSALAATLKELYGKNDFGVCIETHGRERLHKNIDVNRTVGWFTSYFPMILKCRDTLNETVVSVKDTMRSVPKKGIAYPLFFDGMPEKADLIYNFNGVLREGNKFTKETFRKNAARNAIPDKIAINSIVLNGELCVFVSFKGNIHANAAADIGIEYEKQLKNLIIYCGGHKESVKTVSDYSDPDLKESELEEFERMFNETEDE